MSPIKKNKSGLDTRICVFLSNSGIQKEQLAYKWKGWNENNAVKLFSWFHKDLRAALDKDDDHEISLCIERILAWGGINKNKKNTKMIDERFPEMLRNLDIQDGNLNQEDIDDSLPSWTKVLAAYAPDEFCIYDSRVAIALRFLIRDKEWFIPYPYGQNTMAAYKELKKIFDKKNWLTPKESYWEYLDLLRNASPDNPGKYEKQLFMLGGVLAEMCATDPPRWNKALNS